MNIQFDKLNFSSPEWYPGSYGQNQKIESNFKSSPKSQTHDISISVGNI